MASVAVRVPAAEIKKSPSEIRETILNLPSTKLFVVEPDNTGLFSFMKYVFVVLQCFATE